MMGVLFELTSERVSQSLVDNFIKDYNDTLPVQCNSRN